jgi:hypothetical protein
MNERIAEILLKIQGLEERLAEEAERSRAFYDYALKGKLAVFRAEALARHRALRQNLFAYLFSARFLHVLSAPVIYSMILPIALLDLWVTLYQRVCFPIYGIPLVRRAEYVAIDRHHLRYLNGIEVLNCVYCGYGNGVFGYAREVAARTEQYWCPIKHARRLRDPHRLYLNFLEYGDAEGYHASLDACRAALKKEEDAPSAPSV